eukprot:gene61514-84146_t
MVTTKFLPAAHRHSICVDPEPAALLGKLRHFQKTDVPKWLAKRSFAGRGEVDRRSAAKPVGPPHPDRAMLRIAAIRPLPASGERPDMRRILTSLLIAGSLAVPFASGAAAADPIKIKFTLDWKIQGVHAPYYWAKAKGYFKDENLDVTIDQGEGSAATVTRVMSGLVAAFCMMALMSPKPGEAP